MRPEFDSRHPDNMKRAYLIHGWEGYPENNWFPWLKKELEKKGFEVFIPAMPEPETPNRFKWVKTLQDLIQGPDKDVYLIGHSMGCQAIQRYLELLPENTVVGGAILVAGWINDPRWEGRTEEEMQVINDWFDVPKDYQKIKSHCKKFISIFSSDDPFILKSNWKESEEMLGAKVIVIPNKNHFDDEAGIKQLPEVLEAMLNLSK